VRFFFHISVEGSTTKDENGRGLSGQDLAMLHAAVVAAALTRDGEFRRGYLVCAVDEQGHEVARCQSSPRPGAKPAKRRLSSSSGQERSDGRSVLDMRQVSDQPGLTAREREVMTWISLGKSAWEIGEILGITKRTIDEHAQTATRKLGATNRTQAVAIAVRGRLVEF
jgi:LuxR family quorum sensing-dependent transcriptional regulator